MAHLLIIELPGGNDADIVQAACARGDSFVFLSSDLGLYRRQAGIAGLLAQALDCLEVPGFGYDDVEHAVLAAHAARRFDAVLCLLDIRLVDAACLAERLGLRHLAPEGARLLRDKYQVRCRLAERGIAQEDFALAQSNVELQQAVHALGLPLLVKPADGYGSQNIAALRDPWDLDPLLGPLVDMLPAHTDYGLGVHANDRLLVERLLEGTVLGCDVLSCGGRHHLVGVHEKLFFAAPSFAIRGSCFSSTHAHAAAIVQLLNALLDAVGFADGAAHVELMLTAQGLRLIEINARLVGAKIARLVNYALERDLHQELIALHCGQWQAPEPGAAAPRVAVTRWIVAAHSGILDRVELPPSQDVHIRAVEMQKQPGDAVRPPLDNADRIGYVMVCAPTRAQAELVAEDFVARSRVHLRDASGP